MRFPGFTALLLGALLAGAAVRPVAAAQDMQPPQIVTARVDWLAALRELSAIPEFRAPAITFRDRRSLSRANRPLPRPLRRLNAAMGPRFPGVEQSPVPVLLPFDSTALVRDIHNGAAPDGSERYLSGFRASRFFYPGASGYDAVFALHTDEVEGFRDIKYARPIDVLISGSLLLYELDDPTPATGTPVAELDDLFPGIRRLVHEHHLRYTFVRYGVPYVVSAICFNAGVARYGMPTCRSADRVLQHFLRSLRLAGGTPAPARIVEPLAIERPVEPSPDFTYHPPGRLLRDTGFRGAGGKADSTVYSQIRFPLAEAPAFVNSQLFQSRNRNSEGNANYTYPWRDNFCERRGFPVGQCPAGVGHQGQDIRAPRCPPGPGGDKCMADHNLVAVRDGAILRRPRQEAVYLFVNTASERIRFRYLHMLPRKMDEDNLLSGRTVLEGEVIAQIGNFSKREGGTSYHLHFDIQVPTRNGWVFVNPYMTLVAAYERLLGQRGEMFAPVATKHPGTTGSSGDDASSIEPGDAEKTKAERNNGKKRIVKHRKASKKYVKRGKPAKRHIKKHKVPAKSVAQPHGKPVQIANHKRNGSPRDD